MIVRFDCGCIGLTGVQGGPLIINPCDLNGDACWEPLQIHPRDMQDKGFTPVPEEEALALYKELNSLLNDGYRFRRVKQLLS
jgi:hypothetical protein